MFGQVGESWQWWIADLLIFGESIYGEEAFQVIEATTAERYDLLTRITGKSHGTLMNIRTIGAKVAKFLA